MIRVSFKQLSEAIQLLPPKKPVLVFGVPGIGKSHFARQLGKELGLSKFFDIRLSQNETSDIIGRSYSDPKTGQTRYHPPVWMAECAKGDALLLFDEIGLESREVSAAIFQIVHDRCFTASGIEFPDSVRIIAAGNLGDEFGVRDLSPALINRFATFELVPTLQEWIEWAISVGVHSSVVRFVSQSSGELLDPPKQYTPNEPITSRRAWVDVSKTVYLAEQKFGQIDRTNEGAILIAVASHVGEKAAAAYSRYLVNDYIKVSPEDIFNNFQKAKTALFDKEGGIRAFNEVAVLMGELACIIAERAKIQKELTREQQKNFMSFLNSLNSRELLYKFFNSFLNFSKEMQGEQIEFLSRHMSGAKDDLNKVMLDALNVLA